MQLIRGLKNLKKIKSCICTIGNFDGVHLAHQQILQNLKIKANELNIPSVVISFVPNPSIFFDKHITDLSSFKEKYDLIQQLKIDKLLFINFNRNFANINPQTFIDNILLKQLGVKYLLIGDDFRFGKNRIGNFELLNSKIKTKKINELIINNIRVSSSNIRKFLVDGKVKKANQLLGREFSISGKVIIGAKLGRTIGFPTANIATKNRILPFSGVFIVEVILANKSYKAVANIGNKPTIFSNLKTNLEVHILDFNQNIYGKYLTVIFKEKIRDEKKFNSLDELRQQIKLDIINSKKYRS